MIPWLLVTSLLSKDGKKLSGFVAEQIKAYPSSGEINRRLDNAEAAITRVRSFYEDKAHGIDETDGISMEFDGWRFNLRCSNTEPLVRLNVESRGNVVLMQEKTEEILGLI